MDPEVFYALWDLFGVPERDSDASGQRPGGGNWDVWRGDDVGPVGLCDMCQGDGAAVMLTTVTGAVTFVSLCRDHAYPRRWSGREWALLAENAVEGGGVRMSGPMH